MGAALTDNNPLDLRAAIRAILSGALIDTEVVLKITSPVNPVNAGSVTAYALFQNLSDRAK